MLSCECATVYFNAYLEFKIFFTYVCSIQYGHTIHVLLHMVCSTSNIFLFADLLRRLSRAQNTIFCGRILLFLANYFPFSDRSGLNIVSEFNSDNITSYKSGDGSDDPEDKMEMVEDHDDKLFEGIEIVIPGLDKIVSITQEEKKKKVKVDYNLYVKFWSLQDFFRNPTQCYNKVSWKSFMLV